MAERQVGHWKSCLVLSASFPSSTEVTVLLLNQRKNISLGPRKGGCVRLTEKTAVCILYLIKTYNRRQNVLRIYLFLPWSLPCNVVPMFELPIENNKHPNFELREQRRGVDSFVLWGYRLCRRLQVFPLPNVMKLLFFEIHLSGFFRRRWMI